MKNLSCPTSWLLLDLVLDSFIYHGNKPLAYEIHRSVIDALNRLDCNCLYDYDTVERCLHWLVNSDRVNVSFDYVEQDERFSRVDLMSLNEL